MRVEVNRHLFHIAFGTALALLFHYQLASKVHVTLLLAAGVLLFFLYRHWKIPIFHHALLALERKENMQTTPGIGALHYLLGCTIAVWVFPPAIAVAAILMLAWGDGVAGLARAHYVQPFKTWLSTFLGIVSGTLASQFFVPFFHAFVAACAAMLLERIHWKKPLLDDNLVIPLAAGIVLLVIHVIF